MSIDTHNQVKDAIMDEINDWIVFWDYDVEINHKLELVEALYNRLNDGGALDRALQHGGPYDADGYSLDDRDYN